ncbi:molybdate ABC transporter substrate-binding protein [Rhodopirellula sp. MGV]|uniref:molybdate ABC transporter substrate-binding protein n=1 Tax=Rhodopirellula sp. MGV TaxID=2023130 RepID=UPI000B96EF53|nr:molybdate ABC transporter substrate-binding protein [Rhodopirellula sp. MGV]OYP36329.1 molybdate ABC transporter substrate-binding protein [Rhodopirellula sp. MGV]PNY38437.1 molybdate ABC transporter substrate-binding protein [Rhodopirellula baltica]
MNRTYLWMLGSGLLVAGLVYVMGNSGGSLASRQTESENGHNASVMLFCAASNRAVMESVRQRYQDEYGVEVEVQYGPSQTLLSSIEVAGQGDLFLPADDSYLELADEKGLVAETLPLAKMRAVVVVAKDNPKGIRSIEDLQREDIRLVLANPETAAIGKVTKRVLQSQGLWAGLESKAATLRATVNEVASDVAIGAADAGIVYDAVLKTFEDVDYVVIDELSDAASDIAIGVIGSSKQPAAALHFARYVTARDRGLQEYGKFGFTVDGGDRWADTPELSVFAGSMLRPAIEETIQAFEQREGVKVNRVYNGCGILVAQMKAGQKPDAYFACDLEFMNQVHDLFPEPVPVSNNELVIMVQKGNPKNIHSLKDLSREGLRVGIGHEKQCAMGWITQNTFREGGVTAEVMPNVTVQTPTGDMLVNQLQTGSLDAAVAYLSNAAGASEFLDAIRIEGIECSIATQPWAVSKESEYPQLASRLFRKISSADSRDIFAAEGFRWRLDSAGP